MKIFLVLMLSLGLLAHATVNSQTVSYSAKKATLKKVFREVEKQTGYFIFYSSKDILPLVESEPISISAKAMPLASFIQNILKDQPLSYKIEANTISLKMIRNPAPPVNNPSVFSKDNNSPPTISINGSITDFEGEAIKGATVSVANSRIFAVADAKGNFKLGNIPENAHLLISSVGFMPVSVQINGSAFSVEPLQVTEAGLPIETEGNAKSTVSRLADGTFNVKLARLIKSIENVVLTGIYQRNINNFTGASRTMSGVELKKVNANSVFAAVAALDPSFRVVPNNMIGGSINQLPEIQMRGQNSFPNLSGEVSNNPNAPLFILDGFEVTLQRIVDLDINLINSVTLLKDASATAIYGSRGANGVMVVTTITPKQGKIQVSVTNDFRFTTPDLSVYNLLDAKDKLNFEQRAGVYTSPSVQVQSRYDVLYNERYKAALNGVNTDWLSIPLQNGYNNRTSLYLQGGDASIRYGLQVNADLQNGVMKGQNRNNLAGQFDLNYIVNKVQFRNSIRIFQNKSNESPYGDFSEYVRLNPYWTPYDDEGKIKRMLEDYNINNNTFRQINPMYDATLNSINREQYFGISNNFQVRYTPFKSFFIESNLSVNKQNSSLDMFYSAQDSRFVNITDINQKGSYTVGNTNTGSYESLTTANFNYVSGKSQIFSTLGFNISSTNNNSYTIVTQGFPFDRLDNLLFAAQYQANGRPTGDESTVRRLGAVYSGSYSWDNRFLADVSARRDGSSQFGSEKRYGNFWSAGLGWNLHNEKFFTKSDIVNRLKIRASYGTTGSLNIPAYQAQSRYNFGVSTSYFGELGATLIGLGNRFLSWQNVYKSNAGIDAVLFKERLDLRIDIYQENTKNALTQITLAPSTGFASYTENLGEIQNNGFEFSARFKVLEDRSRGLLWSLNVNGFTNKNILKKLSNKLKASNEKLDNENSDQVVPNVLFEEGKSMNAIYVVRSLGVDPATGSEVYLTRNGEKTFVWSAADKVAYGINQPKWNGNFGTNFMLKGFELNLIFNTQFGGQLYNQTLIDRVESVNPRFNVDRRAYDLGWSGPGDVSQYTRIGVSTIPTRLTSRFVQDNNNVTLTSASVGYNFFQSNLIKRLGLRTLQITAITNDLFRLSSIEIERGTSNPFARTYSLSLRAGF